MNLKLAALLKSKIFIACASSVAAVTTAVAVAVAVNQPDAYRMIKIFDLIGSATIERSGIGELDAYTEMNLESGDIVDVHDGSTMHLNLDDDKYIQLDGGTRLELIATGTASDSLTTINLMEGTILNEITSPLSESSSYTVNTPKSTMAVRGTSFVVSVEQNPDGSYMTNLYAFHGVVEVQLIDEEGNPKGETVQVLEDQAVAIMTTQNDATTNDANIDGYSFFVVEDGEDGTYRPVSEGESPVTGFDYNDIPESMLRQALSTNNNNEISLDDVVLQEILNTLNGDQSSVSGNDTVSENEAEETLSNSVSNNGAETSDATISDNTVSENEVTVPRQHVSENELPVTPSENVVPVITVSENTVSQNTVSRNTVSRNTTTTTTTTATTEDSSESSSSGSSGSSSSASENTAEYTVTFVHGLTSEVLDTQTVPSGESASAPGITSTYYYDGKVYNFTGWSSDFSNITGDLTVTAQFTVSTYTVTFSARNRTSGEYETVGDSLTVDYNTVLTDSQFPSIDTTAFTVGDTIYQFSDWAYADSGITSNTTIEANYTQTAATHTVTFQSYDDDGELVSKNFTVAHGNIFPQSSIPIPLVSHTQTVNGTTTEYSPTGVWDGDTTQPITEDRTFMMQYTSEVISYTVGFNYFNSDGSAARTEVQVAPNSLVPSDEIPAPPNYNQNTGGNEYLPVKFNSWENFDPNSTTITSPLEVNAVYEPTGAPGFTVTG